MTKTLTEQWRDGTLPDGFYYVNGKWINYYSKDDGYFDDGGIEEVLAPVPSYNEYKRLQEQLAIATKALKEYAEVETHDWLDSQAPAKRALKEMEGVK